jgi:hypothetical protein
LGKKDDPMNYLSAAIALSAWLFLSSGIALADKSVSKNAALEAIAVFQKDASSAEGVAAASTIMSFARSSDAVHLSLSKAVVPWLKGQDAPDADTRGMLLTAYVAGNMQAQIKSGKAADDVYAGWQQVLATYAQLVQINPAAKLPEIEELKKKEAAGALRAYAAEVEKK